MGGDEMIRAIILVVVIVGLAWSLILARRERDPRLTSLSLVYLLLLPFTLLNVFNPRLLDAVRGSGLQGSLISGVGLIVLFFLDRALRERRQSAENANEEGNLLKTLINHLPDHVYMKDTQGRYLMINRSYAKTIGVVAPEEVIGKMAAGFFPKEQAERDDAEEQGVIKSGRSIEDREWSIRDGAGKKRWFLTAKVPLTNPNGKIMGVLVVDRDITGPKQAAESLRESEERFELAVRGTSDAIWDWNIITGQDYWSSRLYELLGYEVGTIEASFATIKSRLHADDTDSALEALRAHLKDRAPYDVEYRLRTKSGEYRWFRSRGQAVWDETNTARRMVGFIQEITERRQLQAALRETQQLLNSTPDPIIIVNDKGNITVVNTQSEKTFGFNRSELLGQPETP